jgi:hypothetical protein
MSQTLTFGPPSNSRKHSCRRWPKYGIRLCLQRYSSGLACSTSRECNSNHRRQQLLFRQEPTTRQECDSRHFRPKLIIALVDGTQIIQTTAAKLLLLCLIPTANVGRFGVEIDWYLLLVWHSTPRYFHLD